MPQPVASFAETLQTRARRGILVLVVLAWALPTIAWSQKAPVGSEFQVNSYTTGFYTYEYPRPRVASDLVGNFVVVWSNAYRDDGGPFARKFNSDGVPLGPEFPIDDWGFQSAVASDSAGNFVVVWSAYYDYARQFDSTGTPLGAKFVINTDLSDYVSNPKVTSDAVGDFVVAWPGSNTQT